MSLGRAMTVMDQNNYIYAAPGDFAGLSVKVDAIKAKTDNLPASPANEATAAAAVVKAETSGHGSQYNPHTLLLHNENVVLSISRTNTAVNVTMTAGNPATPGAHGRKSWLLMPPRYPQCSPPMTDI